MKDSVNYMLTALLSTMGIALKYCDQILFNRYMAGRETVEEFSSGAGPSRG